jgi:hypothetical protein
LPGQIVLGKGNKESVGRLNAVTGDAAQNPVLIDALAGRFAVGDGIAGAAVQQTVITPGCSGGNIVTFQQRYRSPQRAVARDPCAGGAAANDNHIAFTGFGHLPVPLLSFYAI